MQALNFYSGHGCNVRLPDLQTAEHSYRRAQGLFILATPLNEESKFQLRFEGEGVVKIHAVQTKAEALDWLHSSRLLPKGCLRLRNNTQSLVWDVSFDSRQHNVVFVNRTFGTKRVHGGAMLLFDIEFGKVCVTALSGWPAVTFDTIQRSPYIEFVCKMGISSARLLHFNRLGLCRLLSPVRKGDSIRLSVIGKRGQTGLGPHFRLRIRRADNSNQNISAFLKLGPADVVDSKIVWVETSQQKRLILICRDGPESISSATDRDGVEKMVLSWSWAQHAFIWFELNKVTLRAWSPPQDESMLKAYSPQILGSPPRRGGLQQTGDLGITKNVSHKEVFPQHVNRSTHMFPSPHQTVTRNYISWQDEQVNSGPASHYATPLPVFVGPPAVTLPEVGQPVNLGQVPGIPCQVAAVSRESESEADRSSSFYLSHRDLACLSPTTLNFPEGPPAHRNVAEPCNPHAHLYEEIDALKYPSQRTDMEITNLIRPLTFNSSEKICAQESSSSRL